METQQTKDSTSTEPDMIKDQCSRGIMRPPRTSQIPPTHFQEGLKEWTMQHNWSAQKVKALASVQENLSIRRYPTKPWLHTPGHPISQTNTRNQDWWSLFLSFSLSCSLIHLFPSLFPSTLTLLCKQCAHMVGQELTYPFQCQVCNLQIKPSDFLWPLWLLWSHSTTSIYESWVLPSPKVWDTTTSQV